jgi:hypothetical protein
MADSSAAPATPRYLVLARPGPGLATITDRRDGTTRRWSRSLGRGQGNRRGRRCAACARALQGGFYRPPQILPAIDERLCVACVEGDDR